VSTLRERQKALLESSGLLESQVRVITYVDVGLSTAIALLDAAGVPEHVIALQLEPAIDAGLALQEEVVLGSPRCWRWSIPGDVVGQWLVNGGPLDPRPGGLTLFDVMPWDTVDCESYFAGVARLEMDLSAALAAVNVPGWPEVLRAAADEARSRAQEIRGPLKIPLWLIALAGVVIFNQTRRR
jgi:hypothetical protein